MMQKGIHAKIDAFPEKNGLTAEEICRGLKAEEDRRRVGPRAEDRSGSRTPTSAVLRVGHGRGVRQADGGEPGVHPGALPGGAQFTMDLWYTAWLRSATLPRHY